MKFLAIHLISHIVFMRTGLEKLQPDFCFVLQTELSLYLSFSYLIHIPVPFFHCITLLLASTQTLHRPRTVGHSLGWAELDPPTRERLLFAVKSSLLCLPSQHIHFRPQLRSLCVAFEFHSLCIHALMRFMTYCQATFNY